MSLPIVHLLLVRQSIIDYCVSHYRISLEHVLA